MKFNSLKVSIITILAFGVSMYSYKVIFIFYGSILKNFNPLILNFVRYITWLIPVFIAMVLFHGFNIKIFLRELGLDCRLIKGISFSFFSTLPMLIGYFVLFGNPVFSFREILMGALFPAFMEEILFRGFLFGYLYRKAGWGFVPAVAISSIFFAIGHFYQSQNITGALIIFFITFTGGAWFSWLFIEWDKNLWVPIGIHLFMNLWWIVFSAGENVMGGKVANVFRLVTIAITVVLTIYMRKGKMKLTKEKLLQGKKFIDIKFI